MSSRIDAIQARVSDSDVDAALITQLTDIRWAVGFSGSNGILIVRRDDAHLVTDGRYTEQAREEVEAAVVHVPGYRLYDHVEEAGLLEGAERVLCQADHLTVHQYDEIRSRFSAIEWKPVSQFMVSAVASKSPGEIDRIRRAQQITDRVFSDLLTLLRPGVTEREIGAEIVYRHIKYGAERVSFDPIVASGNNGAKPHARPTDRSLQNGELVIIDMGCFVEGYASDMTRTVAMGEPGDEAREVYAAVLDAQEAALEAARAGMSSKTLDAVARDALTDAGYGEYFTHGLGHGVGLNIHEWPRLSYHTDDRLPEKAVVTIEPGVYIPDSFGIRIEDIVVLREDGCENLTASRKDLIIL